MSKVITVSAGKGGTGRTTAVAALASCLAALGYKTLCVDYDRGRKNLEAALCLPERRLSGARNAAGDRRGVAGACREHPRIPNLFYLSPYAHREPDGAGEADAAALINAIRREFDFCIVDAPSINSPAFKTAHANADMSIIVTNCDLPTMGDVQKAASLIKEAGVKTIRLLVNRYSPGTSKWVRQGVRDVAESVGVRLVGIIPEDKIVFQALHLDIPLLLFYKRYSAYHFLDVARRLTGKAVPSRIRLRMKRPESRRARPQQPKKTEPSEVLPPPEGLPPPEAEQSEESEKEMEIEQPVVTELIPDNDKLLEPEPTHEPTPSPEPEPTHEPTPSHEPEPPEIPDPEPEPPEIPDPEPPPAKQTEDMSGILPKTKVRSFGDPVQWAKSTLPPCDLDGLVGVYDVKEGVYSGAETIRDRIWLHDVLDDNEIPYHIEIEGYWPGRRKFVERQVIYVEEKNASKAKQLIKEYNNSVSVPQDLNDEDSQVVGIEDGIPQKLCPSCGAAIDFDFVVCPRCKARI